MKTTISLDRQLLNSICNDSRLTNLNMMDSLPIHMTERHTVGRLFNYLCQRRFRERFLYHRQCFIHP